MFQKSSLLNASRFELTEILLKICKTEVSNSSYYSLKSIIDRVEQRDVEMLPASIWSFSLPGDGQMQKFLWVSICPHFAVLYV